MLPRDTNSIVADIIKRYHYQILLWKDCAKANIDLYEPSSYGWRFNEQTRQYCHVWYEESMIFSLSFNRESSGTSTNEENEPHAFEPPRKRMAFNVGAGKEQDIFDESEL